MTCDNKRSSAPLGRSKVFCVQYSPSHAIPEFIQGRDNNLEVCSVVAIEKAHDIFENEPFRLKSFSKLCKPVEKSASATFQTFAFSLICKAEVLAGKSSTPDVCRRNLLLNFLIIDVTYEWNVRPVLAKNLLAKFVFLALENDFKTGALEA